MTRTVTVEELREKLEEIIAEVKAGETVTIVPDEQAANGAGVAQKGKRFPFRDLKFEPLDLPFTVDAVKLIREDRDHELKKHGLL